MIPRWHIQQGDKAGTDVQWPDPRASFMRPRCWLDLSPLAPRELEVLEVEEVGWSEGSTWKGEYWKMLEMVDHRS